MVPVVSIESNAIALAVCLLMLFSIKPKTVNTRKEYRNIISMLSILITSFACFMLFTVFNSFDKSMFRVISGIFNSVYLIANGAICIYFFRYVLTVIFKNLRTAAFIVSSVPFVIAVLCVLINPFTGGLFTISEPSKIVYGNYYIIYSVCNLIYGATSIFLLLLFGKKIGQKKSRYLLSLLILPIAGFVIQNTLGGENLIGSCCAISVLIFYVNALRDKGTYDYLSGLYNRMQADDYIESKIRHATKNNSFSGMMIDVDNFKFINDSFGHAEGDRAIEKVSQILKHNVSKHDFVARQGGDEFLLILNTGDFETLSNVASHLTYAFDKYNKTHKNDYDITISMGYDVYNANSSTTRKQFMRHLDELMYINKRNKKILKKAAAST